MTLGKGKACATCKRVLNRKASNQGWQWVHPLGERFDHDPVPVAFDEVDPDIRCDFCHAPRPEFILPVYAFQMGQGQRSDEDWTACTTCADLLKADDWTGILRRARNAWIERHGPMPMTVLANLTDLYRQVQENTAGAVRPA